MRYKNKYIKYENTRIAIIIISLLLVLSISNVIESYNFFKHVNMSNDSDASTDIIVYILCGLTTQGKTDLLDILRFSIPYILILFMTGIYITDILNDNRKYFYIIRCKSYKNWIRKIFIKLIFIVIMLFLIYYIFLIMISWIFIGKFSDFTTTFHFIYPFYDSNSSFFKLILLQFILSVSIEFLLVLVQFLLELFSKDNAKNFIILILIIIVASFIGKYDCYNPLMLSKHIFLNTNLSYNPLNTIASSITFILIINLLMGKMIKLARRTCLYD